MMILGIKRILFICLFSFVGLINIFGQKVKTAGKAMLVMQGIDLSSNVLLDTIVVPDNTYAVGPVEDLQGEITIFEGVPYISYIENNEIRTEINRTVKAPFLAYANVEKWSSFELEFEVNNQDELSTLIEEYVNEYLKNYDEPFPFLVKGNFEYIKFHVIMRNKENEFHSHELHKQSKVIFERDTVDGILVGFFSKHHEGVFTHKGKFTHIHYLAENRSETGHLDGIRIKGKVILMFPF
jgi:acetolactate decarboxylase